MSQKYSLPAGMLTAVCYVETRHDPFAVHHADGDSDSLGICQIKLKTARWLGFKGTEKQLMQPEVNIEYAAKYLAQNLHRYKGDVVKAIIAYNIGHAGKLAKTKYSDRVVAVWRSNGQ